jgi:oligopeptide transport system substrate-binding protein
MKNICYWLLLLIALGAVSACRQDPRAARIKANEAVINLGADPRTLDPSLATDTSSARAILALQRGLTVLDEQGTPHSDLAASWTISPDQRVYEFKLRPQNWSNGQPVTADDFVYAWTQRMLNPKFGSENSIQLFYLKGARAFYANQALGANSVGVAAPAPDRLRVELANPAPFFLQLAAHHSYFPVCRAADQQNPKWAQRAETYIGNGPFLLKSYQPGNELVAEKNPHYWNAAHVQLARLTYKMIEKESTSRIQLDTGEIDAMESLPRDELETLRGKPELHFSTMLSTYMLFLNCKHKPLDDARVRRALALAVDRKAITEHVTRAGETPAFYFTPPKMYTTPPEPLYQDADYEGARKLLAEAGFPGGKGFPKLRYIYNTMDAHKKIAEVLQETWRRELGIDISVENQEFKVVINNRRSGNFDIARAGWVADFSDPLNFLEILDSKSENNDSHWVDPHYDALLAQMRLESDPQKREALFKAGDRYLMEQMPLIPIYTYTNPYLCTPRLHGYVLGPTGMFDPARLAWSDQ